jgi:hypothetical protein
LKHKRFLFSQQICENENYPFPILILSGNAVILIPNCRFPNKKAVTIVTNRQNKKQETAAFVWNPTLI